MFILYVDYNLSLSFLEAGRIADLDYKEYINKEGGGLVGAVPTLPSSRFDDHFGDDIN